jgi:hypothetical protein
LVERVIFYEKIKEGKISHLFGLMERFFNFIKNLGDLNSCLPSGEFNEIPLTADDWQLIVRLILASSRNGSSAALTDHHGCA